LFSASRTSPIQGGGDGALAVGHHVLVAQRYRRRGVPHAFHQLLGRRAGGRGQGGGRGPQVVEAQPAQAEHAAESLSKGSRVVVVGRLQQQSWTAADGSARSVVEVVTEELGPSLRWATATTTRATRSQSQ
jgi:hypothetical protein